MKVIQDVACPACGCVCDDLRITCDKNRITRIEPPCPLAEKWYAGVDDATAPAAMIEGKTVSAEEAIARAAEILRSADAPLLYGLSRSSTAGQRAAVALADQLGATIDTTATLCHGPSIMAVQQKGEPTSTLGEVAERADLVLFWGNDTARTHPRHFERYSVDPVSDLLPRGRQDRTIVMVDAQPHTSPEEADVFLSVPPGSNFEALNILRLLVRAAVTTGSTAAIEVTPIDWPPALAREESLWRQLAKRMCECRCGVVFFGLGLSQSLLGHISVSELLKLVAELNALTHFYARRLRIHGDVTGADSVLCWQTGYPFSVNLARGYPRYNPGEFSAHEILARNETDACLLIGTETLDWFPPEAIDALQHIPTIVLDYPNAATPWTPTVLFRTAVYGVHSPGTVYRMDEVPIPLRAFLETSYPTDEFVLQQIAAACGSTVPR